MLAKELDQELNKRHLNAYFQILILLHNNDSITKLTDFKIVIRYFTPLNTRFLISNNFISNTRVNLAKKLSKS